jgi:hypothetical protein
LNARLTAGKLSSEQLEKIADAGLACQADLSKPWDTGWGDLLEAMQARGSLSDVRWKRYLTMSMLGAFDLRLRKTVGHGDDLPWEIERQSNRAGSSVMNLQISFDSSGVEWLSKHGPTPHLPLSFPVKTSLGGPGSGSGGGAFPTKLLASEFPEPLSDGVQQVHIHGIVKVGFRSKSWNLNPIVSGEIDLPGSFMLLPANTPVVKDPQQALHDQQVRKSFEFDASWCAGTPPMLSVEVTQDSLPFALDVTMLARADGHEVTIGGFGMPARPPTTVRSSMTMQNNWPGAKPRCIDIVVRSNPDFIPPALWNDDNLWTGEIIFKDVPVK